MPLNLLTLTKADGTKIEVNPSAIVYVETINSDTIITLVTGPKIVVRDPQTKIRERVNSHAPDGFN